MIPLSVTIEEFEQGAWVAETVSLEQFDGTIELAGMTWTGTKVAERFEFERYHTQIVGGKNGLSTVIADKYYSGSSSLQVAVQDVCREAGETFGSAALGEFLSTFARLKGNAAAALDVIAEAFEMIWWIDRNGELHMQSERPTPTADVKGNRVSSDDVSALLSEPENLVLGATYGDDAQPIRHIRWQRDAQRFEARIYFVPFIFRPPTENRYASLRRARVERQNSDDTIDVITETNFGIQKVPLFCGVPGSKVKVNAGENVTIGFLGGDPQKPFAVAMAQDTTATKKVARMGDGAGGGSLAVVFAPGGAGASLSLTYTPGDGGPPQLVSGVGGTINFGERITSGSERLKVGD